LFACQYLVETGNLVSARWSVVLAEQILICAALLMRS